MIQTSISNDTGVLFKKVSNIKKTSKNVEWEWRIIDCTGGFVGTYI